MNYAKAVKGVCTDPSPSIMFEIQEQADLEIRRCLTRDEINGITMKYSLEQFMQSIKKVVFKSINNSTKKFL